MELSFCGYGENAATFSAQEGIAEGMPVKMTANGEVGACSAGENFCGAALNTRGGYAAVQLAGYAVLSYSGTVPAVGYQNLAAADDGKIEVLETGRSLLVVDVDTAAQTCGVIL